MLPESRKRCSIDLWEDTMQHLLQQSVKTHASIPPQPKMLPQTLAFLFDTGWPCRTWLNLVGRTNLKLSIKLRSSEIWSFGNLWIFFYIPKLPEVFVDVLPSNDWRYAFWMDVVSVLWLVYHTNHPIWSEWWDLCGNSIHLVHYIFGQFFSQNSIKRRDILRLAWLFFFQCQNRPSTLTPPCSRLAGILWRWMGFAGRFFNVFWMARNPMTIMPQAQVEECFECRILKITVAMLPRPDLSSPEKQSKKEAPKTTSFDVSTDDDPLDWIGTSSLVTPRIMTFTRTWMRSPVQMWTHQPFLQM